MSAFPYLFDGVHSWPAAPGKSPIGCSRLADNKPRLIAVSPSGHGAGWYRFGAPRKLIEELYFKGIRKFLQNGLTNAGAS